MNKQRRERYKKNKKKILEQQKKYNEKPQVKERIKNYQREYQREYRKKNPEKVKAIQKRHSMSDKRKKYLKEYWQRPEVIERQKKKRATKEYKDKKKSCINDGRYSQNKKCPDCEKIILNASERCKSCSPKIHSFGENHYNWQGGISFVPYTRNFKKFLRQLVRLVYNQTCVNCGKTEEKLGYSLHAHHVDYNKDNNTLYNLLPLCRSCHGKTASHRKGWQWYYSHFQSECFL